MRRMLQPTKSKPKETEPFFCNRIARMILQGRHLMLSGEYDRHKGSLQKSVGHETKRDEAGS